jgi:hypothetical protein
MLDFTITRRIDSKDEQGRTFHACKVTITFRGYQGDPLDGGNIDIITGSDGISRAKRDGHIQLSARCLSRAGLVEFATMAQKMIGSEILATVVDMIEEANLQIS